MKKSGNFFPNFTRADFFAPNPADARGGFLFLLRSFFCSVRVFSAVLYQSLSIFSPTTIFFLARQHSFNYVSVKITLTNFQTPRFFSRL
jgi:hypothetical protein